ncbi:DUF368 domain-containing protein, partial [Candidatus Bipolaricaulota bacterium]|nr:DUF368 domain-containing protein [Candidatus Bipolaricaulota bacterium]
RSTSLVVLGSVVAAASLAVLLCAGTVKDLVVTHRWVMYSVFIGLTLGGLPIVLKLIGKWNSRAWWGAAGGFVAMGLLALLQLKGVGGTQGGATGMVMFFVAGVAGASAMILPGVSGGYLLLVLGQYVPILAGIDRFKESLRGGDFAAALNVGCSVGLPVGLGVLIGVVGVSNILRILLKRYKHATLGVLLGLLLGAVVGLWPFQQGVKPMSGDVVKGTVMTAELVENLSPDDYPTEFFRPSVPQVLGAAGMIILGFVATFGLSRLTGGEQDLPG